MVINLLISQINVDSFCDFKVLKVKRVHISKFQIFETMKFVYLICSCLIEILVVVFNTVEQNF